MATKCTCGGPGGVRSATVEEFVKEVRDDETPTAEILFTPFEAKRLVKRLLNDAMNQFKLTPTEVQELAEVGAVNADLQGIDYEGHTALRLIVATKDGKEMYGMWADDENAADISWDESPQWTQS